MKYRINKLCYDNNKIKTCKQEKKEPVNGGVFNRKLTV